MPDKKKKAYSNEYLVAAKDLVVMCRLMKSRKIREKLKKILIPRPNVVLRFQDSNLNLLLL